MTRAEFHNALRIMTSLDRDALEHAGVLPIGDHNAWGTFRRDPFRWFIRADDAAAEKLFGTIRQRMTVRNYTWIGDDCPPGWRCVGSIDVADPADVHSARDRCLRIGTIYDGGTGSVAEPCAADVYDEAVTVEDANMLASAVERMADNPKGGAPAAQAYIKCARLIRRKLGSVRS